MRSAPVLWLRYAIDGRPRSKPILLNLAERDEFLLPEPLGEYYRYVRFDIEVEAEAEVVDVTASAGRLEARHGRSYVLFVDREHGGTIGTRRVTLTLHVAGFTDTLTLALPITPEHLELAQFHAMIDDMAHWLFVAVASDVELDIDLTDRLARTIRAHQLILSLIERQLPELEATLRRIDVLPRRQLRKQYFQTADDSLPQDGVTQRWQARHVDPGRRLTYRHITSFDVYENHFVLFFLDQLHRRLTFLQQVVERTEVELARQQREAKRFQNQRRIEELERQHREVHAFAERVLSLQRALLALRNLSFLRSLAYDPANFQLTYSLALTQDLNYSRIFQMYQELGRDTMLRRLDRVQHFTKHLTSLGVKATHVIYEYWAFLAVFNELLSMGFARADEHQLLDIIDDNVLAPSLKPEGFVELFDQRNTYGDMRLRLCYERSFYERGVRVACPDIVLDVWKPGGTLARLVFDAKYKTYTGTSGSGNSIESLWNEDLIQVGIKYQDTKRVDGGRVPQSLGAFLLHINTDDHWFENYGAVMQYSDSAAWYYNSHRFGFIPLVPGRITPLRTLLGMLFRVKLDAGDRVCWTCFGTDIVNEVYRSTFSTERNNKWVCRSCGNTWWQQTCRCCPFPLYKG